MSQLIRANEHLALSRAFGTQELNDMLEKAMQRESRETKKKSFAPSGLGYSGSCFAAETEFVTDEGVKTLAEMAGKEVNVWTGRVNMKTSKYLFHPNGGWKRATVESFGVQPLKKITLQRSGVEREIFATSEHRWIVQSAKYSTAQSRAVPYVKTTDNLKIGDLLWHSNPKHRLDLTIMSNDGIRAGIVFGDGSCDSGWARRKSGSYVVLHGEKDFQLLKYFDGYSISDEFVHRAGDSEYMTDNGVLCRKVYGMPRSYKSLPPLSESAGYLYGWLAGYFAADGNIHGGGSATITSHTKSSILAVRDVCAILGINTGSMRHSIVNKLGIDRDVWSISINAQDLSNEFFLLEHHRDYHIALLEKNRRSPRKWMVVSVEETDRVEEVFCVVQPETERFALADGILTMNCPRYWHYAFNGATFEYDTSATAVANMDAGSAAGERIAKMFDKAGLLVDSERAVEHDDPPIFGYIDLVVNWKGEELIGEVKTTRDATWNYRVNNNMVPGYQMVQLLIYMYVTEHDKGFFYTENKDSHEAFILPVKMNDERKALVENVFDWMRTVKANNELPKRPFTKSSMQCKGCAVRNTCWAGWTRGSVNGTDPNPGTVDLPPLEIPK